MNIDGETRLFGVVGDPIGQAKTPTHINSIFKQRNSNIICVPFHIAAESFPDFWQAMKSAKNVPGFGVTIPHKKSAMRLCDSVSERAQKIGVVNVVRKLEDGRFYGDIFDGISFVAGLKKAGFDPAGHDIFMVGAGGAATAIGFALIEAGANSIAIRNRTMQHAEDLVILLKSNGELKNIYSTGKFSERATMIINATSLGLNEHDPLPIDLANLSSSQIVAEVVAKPEFTKLLCEAKNIGCPVHSGIHMIINQMEFMADFIEGKI